MKLLLLATLITFAARPFALAQATNQTTTANRTDLEPEFMSLLQELADARWPLNEKAVAQRRAITERILADTYVEVLENGDIRTKAELIEARTPETTVEVKMVAEGKFTMAVEHLRVQTYGDTAIVNYLMNVRLVFNGEPVVKLFRCTEVFIKRDLRWQSVMHTETVMPGEPVAAKVESKAFDDYVGQYRLTPSIIYPVSREGDKLFWGRGKQEMVPENGNTFLFKRRPNRRVDFNTSYRVIFVRDDKGRVTHLRMREFPGVEYSAIKLQ